MDDRKIEELRAEIARRAPELTIVAVGRLFGDAVDAIVQDRWGQSMWSVYRKFHGLGEPVVAPEPARQPAPLEQSSLF